MAVRRAPKWQHAPPAAPTPRILNLPLRPGGRPSRSGRAPRPAAGGRNLGALFNLERRVRVESAPATPPPQLHSQDDSGEQEKWRFQAEILRAECNFLRMEREVALRKLDRHRGQMEAALKSAVETLVSGRKKIDGRGEAGVTAALEEEIEDMEEMMEELRVEKESGRGMSGGSGLRELQRSRGRNFDRQASTLRRRLEKTSVDNEPCIKEIREIALPVLHSHQQPHPEPPSEHGDDDSNHSPHLSDVEMLRRKMEGMSKGMRERMAEYSRRLQAVTADSGSNIESQSRKSGDGHKRKMSTSTSQRSCSSNVSHTSAVAEKASHGRCRRGVAAEKHQQKIGVEECKTVGLGSCCDCREVVGKIMEQVRAESEQWSEMQDMLEQVRLEMQELQSSRDTWQRRAIASDINVRSLNAQMLEWRHRAQVSEQNVDELEKKVSELQSKILTLKAHLLNPTRPNQEQSETGKMEIPRIKTQQYRSLESSKEKEKHVLICRVKNSPNMFSKRSPLQEIGNFNLLQQR